MTDSLTVPNQTAFAQYLANLFQSNPVTSIEDICDDQGRIIIPIGETFNDETVKLLDGVELMKPLCFSIETETIFSADDLLNSWEDIMTSYPDIREAHSQLELDEVFEVMCHRFTQYPVLLLNITIMSGALEEQYHKGLFAAWFSLAISEQLQLIPHEKEAAFLAGLAHDVGMLYIEPTVFWSSKLTIEERHRMQEHVIISHDLFNRIPNIPEEAVEAVLEHHEKCDGTGYPSHKIADKLGLFGQIVAIADMIYPIRVYQLEKKNKSLVDITPILQLNSTMHFIDVYSAAVAVVRSGQVKLNTQLTMEKVEEAVETLKARLNLLVAWVKIAGDFNTQLKVYEETMPLQIAFSVLERIKLNLTSSGLIAQGIQRWVNYIADKDLGQALDEIDEISALQEEMLYQFKELGRYICQSAKAIQITDTTKLPDYTIMVKQILSLNQDEMPADIDPSTLDADKILSSL